MKTKSVRIEENTYIRLWNMKNVERKTINDVINYLLDSHDRKIKGGPT